jgi:hypothetical protein
MERRRRKNSLAEDNEDVLSPAPPRSLLRIRIRILMY